MAPRSGETLTIPYVTRPTVTIGPLAVELT
jgi:hypothetical protein